MSRLFRSKRPYRSNHPERAGPADPVPPDIEETVRVEISTSTMLRLAATALLGAGVASATHVKPQRTVLNQARVHTKMHHTATKAKAQTKTAAEKTHVAAAAKVAQHKVHVEDKHPKNRLRVCNAYPSRKDMDVYKHRQKLTINRPLRYKQCRDFLLQLLPGDKIDFKQPGDAEVAGTFSIAELPPAGAHGSTLFLAIHRSSARSTAASFVNHVFANLKNAQVAVLDTHRGGKNSAAMIIKDRHGSRNEELRYDSVVAVKAGLYDTILMDSVGKGLSQQPFVALNQESYVVMRVGVNAEGAAGGDSFPDEILIFPQSDVSKLKGGAIARFGGSGGSVLWACVAAAVSLFAMM